MNATIQVFVKGSKYKNNAWCTYCGVYIPRSMLIKDSAGRDMCPYCHKLVRRRARKKIKNNGGTM